jgi:hypothetical protein
MFCIFEAGGRSLLAAALGGQTRDVALSAELINVAAGLPSLILWQVFGWFLALTS